MRCTFSINYRAYTIHTSGAVPCRTWNNVCREVCFLYLRCYSYVSVVAHAVGLIGRDALSYFRVVHYTSARVPYFRCSPMCCRYAHLGHSVDERFLLCFQWYAGKSAFPIILILFLPDVVFCCCVFDLALARVTYFLYLLCYSYPIMKFCTYALLVLYGS